MDDQEREDPRVRLMVEKGLAEFENQAVRMLELNPDLARMADELVQLEFDCLVARDTAEIHLEELKNANVKITQLKEIIKEIAGRLQSVRYLQTKSEGRKSSILIVDDEAMIREMLNDILVKSGYEVRQAVNGVQAKEMYFERPADLIITDIVMPEKEGLDLILELQAVYPELRFIAISGGGKIQTGHIKGNHHIDAEFYLDLAREIGAFKTLKKPFNPEELLKAVREVLALPE
jgi:CheY-like chemotaxis protein